jgi:hypothetical protein
VGDDATALYDRYMYARVQFRKDAFDPRAPKDAGIFIDRMASPPVVAADREDPDFLAAIYGRDDAIEIEAAYLEELRNYVLSGGPFPRRP